MSTTLLEYARSLNEDVRVILAIPTKERFEDILKTYQVRGNSNQFIESRKKDFSKFYNIVENSEFEKVFINKNEYLSDALIKFGINLEREKGFKNYY